MKTILTLIFCLLTLPAFAQTASKIPSLMSGGSASAVQKTYTRSQSSLIRLTCTVDTANNECTPRLATTTTGTAISAGYAAGDIAGGSEVFKVVAVEFINLHASAPSLVTVGYSDTDCGFEDTACALVNDVPFHGSGTRRNIGIRANSQQSTSYHPDTTVVPNGKFMYVTTTLANSTGFFATIWGYEE